MRPPNELFSDLRTVFRQSLFAWIGIDLAVVTIDDQWHAFQIVTRQVYRTHDRRNTHGPENRS